MTGRLECDELSSLRGDAVRARDIRKSDHAIGVADIEGVADQRHAERLAQPFDESASAFRHAVTVAVRNTVMRLALTPSAATRRIVACIA